MLLSFSLELSMNRNSYMTEYRKTINGVILTIYGGQKGSSKKRGHLHPSYTKKELESWLLSQPLFYMLYNSWVSSGYDRYLKPSVDRKDNSIGYTLDNIQLMTWKENEDKGNIDMRLGKLTTRFSIKSVIQFSLSGCILNTFISVIDASRQTGINQSNISECCIGKKRRTAGGFKWKFADS